MRNSHNAPVLLRGRFGRLLPGALAVLLGVALASAPASARDQRTLTRATEAYTAGKYDEAALGFFDVAENSGEPELSWRAEYFLALTLFKMGLHHSALVYDTFILEQGPNHPYYAKAVENVLDVMEAVGDKTLIPNLLDKEYNPDGFARLDPATINRINFLVALRSHQLRKQDDSTEFLAAVPAAAGSWPRARYLRGVQLAQDATDRRGSDPQGSAAFYADAAKAFQDVLKVPADRKDIAGLSELKEQATLALARVRYAQGKFSESADLYEAIPRFAPQWRDALFEGAYAAFVADEPGRALGMLHTLHSPVFAEHLVPESWLLKAYVYYFSCLFDETKAALAQLDKVYGEAARQVKATLETPQEPEDYFALLGPKGDGVLPAMVRVELRRDEGIRGYRRYIAALEEEQKKIRSIATWERSLLQTSVSESVQQQRNLLVQTAGRGVQRALRMMEYVLDDIEGRADIVRMEMANRQKELIEASFNPEDRLGKQSLGRPRVPAADAEHWPFEGEFWPDEVGFYRYTVKNACPASEATNTAGK